MSVFENEKDLVLFLEEKIKREGYYEETYSDINLASRRFYPYWRKWFGKCPSDYLFPLAQPQIDLIVVDKDHHLLGAEIKYLRLKKSRAELPFYAGIEEALALLRFGFLCVSLWHCFDFKGDNKNVGDIRKYREATHKLVSTLNLPINYSALWITKSKRGKEAIYLPPSQSIYDTIQSQPKLPPLHGKENPLRSMPEVKKIREFLRMSLKIPSTTL